MTTLAERHEVFFPNVVEVISVACRAISVGRSKMGNGEDGALARDGVGFAVNCPTVFAFATSAFKADALANAPPVVGVSAHGVPLGHFRCFILTQGL